MGQKTTSVIPQKGNHPTIPKQEVKISKYPLRAAAGEFLAGSPTAVQLGIQKWLAKPADYQNAFGRGKILIWLYKVKVQEVKVQEVKVQEVKVQEVKVQEVKVQEVKVQEVKVQEVKVQEVKVQEVKVQEVKVQDLG
ncbi:hypothetical protein EV426DRAFT_708277 [Tirmania nivea]|nr:hypothetical protein EV426DRAFT_708277 [Tirmania nivea]